jgi:hypothetical protein
MLDFTSSTTSFTGIIQTCTIAIGAGLGDLIVGNDYPRTFTGTADVRVTAASLAGGALCPCEALNYSLFPFLKYLQLFNYMYILAFSFVFVNGFGG